MFLAMLPFSRLSFPLLSDTLGLRIAIYAVAVTQKRFKVKNLKRAIASANGCAQYFILCVI
jgi:hypothetical protein